VQHHSVAQRCAAWLRHDWSAVMRSPTEGRVKQKFSCLEFCPVDLPPHQDSFYFVGRKKIKLKTNTRIVQ